MDPSTTPRVALVTGGTRGIGAATSLALRQAGYTVAAAYGANDNAAAAFSRGSSIPVFRWNVADGRACRDGVAAVAAQLGPIDILVNNAGITRDRAFRKMADEDWHTVIETNLSSVFHMSRAVIDNMRERGFGRIVNMRSINGQRGRRGQANYSAAKAGMIGLTKALALEYAHRGITVNAIAPGHIDTEILHAGDNGLVDMLVAENPVGRLGTPDEIARCVVFLASDAAGFITGSTLTVNGGAYLT